MTTTNKTQWLAVENFCALYTAACAAVNSLRSWRWRRQDKGASAPAHSGRSITVIARGAGKALLPRQRAIAQ